MHTYRVSGSNLHVSCSEAGCPTESAPTSPHLRGKVDVRLPGKGNSNSHGARPVHLIITMIEWIRTSRLSIKTYLSMYGFSYNNGYRGTSLIRKRAPPPRTATGP